MLLKQRKLSARLRRSESLAAVGQATTQVAHEIRNPLGSIRLGVSMLRDSVNDAEALNTIELVERGIKHLNKLVVDVTQFSRQKELERSSVDLHESLERSIDLVSDKIREKNTTVEKHFAGAIDRGPMGSVPVAAGVCERDRECGRREPGKRVRC